MPSGASGGISSRRVIGAATTNATSVKTSSGLVYGWTASNVNAAAVYLKLYDKASAPTVGTDTPKMTVLIPGGTTGGQVHQQFPSGVSFGSGIALAITGVVTDADTTAVSANEQVVHLFYR